MQHGAYSLELLIKCDIVQANRGCSAYPGGYGKPTLCSAAKMAISEASFRPTEAVHKTVDSLTGFWLTEAVHKTVDSLTGFWLTEAAHKTVNSYSRSALS